MFNPVPVQFDFPAMEQRILSFWDQQQIFEKSLANRQGCPAFVFYEGPPTANGTPHPGHVLTRAIKDLFPRYRTMRGYLCQRKGGWDTHGLPVEIEVEKDLGISGKDQILEYGVEPFVRKCMASVFRYTSEWEQMTRRIGFWVNLDEAYVTYQQPYVESVWWALQTIFNKGLLYRGHKIVPYCPRCGTPLSSHEVGLGYKDVSDPSVFVGFRTKANPKEMLLAWTTTPWTLLSNAALAVRREYTYARVRVGDETLILAADLVDKVLAKVEHEVVETMPGVSLLGTEYEPLYDFAEFSEKAHYVVAADFVTLDSGTGIVHMAPAFGADDYEVGVRNGLPVIQLVDTNGRFVPEVTPWAGQFCKDADDSIVADLKKRNLLLKREQYKHSYPYCWRCDTPLIYYARGSWFIRTTEIKQRLLDNNAGVTWFPDHIKDGRFGNFLRDNIDWALSRERFWGTPLPIWICSDESCKSQRAFGSADEILAANPQAFEAFEKLRADDPDLSEHMRLHKPYIDDVTVPCQQCGKPMHRTSEVVDVWFDSGSMPFAQWGYPHRNKDMFEQAFPADFISEAIDQTRGWFYSLLAISSLLFDKREFPHPFRNCIVLGLVLGKDGKKLSKRLKNYDPADRIFENEGADALRWYFYSGQPPWTSARFDEDAIKETQREFLIRLYNVYSFFVIYANIDGFDPAADGFVPTSLDGAGLAGGTGYRPVSDRSVLDRWVMSELQRMVGACVDALDGYDIYTAAQKMTSFVDGLSNWYVRRSRNRFWASGLTEDKLDAYWTLYECLVTMSRLMAPFTPFFADELYQNLVATPFGAAVHESVHLCDYPTGQADIIDEELSGKMAVVQEIVAHGRAARASGRIKVRQPLGEVEIVLADPSRQAQIEPFDELIREELNVKSVHYVQNPEQYVEFTIKPDFKQLGPRLGGKVKKLAGVLQQVDASDARRAILESGSCTVELDGEPVELTGQDVQISLVAHEGFVASQGRDAMVVLKTELTDELVQEGKAREIVHHVQNIRKEQDLPYEARIELAVAGNETIVSVVEHCRDYIASETLADSVVVGELDGVTAADATVDDDEVRLYVRQVV